MESIIRHMIFVTMTSGRIPFFDIVICRASFHHLSNVILYLWIQPSSEFYYNGYSICVPGQVDKVFKFIDIFINRLFPLKISSHFQLSNCVLGFIPWEKLLNEFGVKGGPVREVWVSNYALIMNRVIGEHIGTVGFHICECAINFGQFVREMIRGESYIEFT